jgi:stringent starvation protein B
VTPTKQRPYLLRAMHEWMVDNGYTPHLVVDAKREDVRVPAAHVKDGKIVLNVSPGATRALSLGNDVIAFEARFGGVAQQLSVPVSAVLGIYARENGQGMIFGEDDPTPAPESPPPTPTPSPPAADERRAKFKVVK